MGLVSATEMLKKAKEGHYAVGQFNINNLEWTKSVLLTAEELKAPVILGVSEGAAKYMTGYTTVAAMVKAMVEALNITVPVALHLDHGSYEGAKAALDAISASRLVSPPSCLMVLIMESKKTSKKQKKSLNYVIQKVFQ